MGAGSSKPADAPKEHLFKPEVPIRLAPDLQQSLEQSAESNTTRASDLELHIQRRVHAELSRLEASTSQQLAELEQRISAAAPEKIADASSPVPTSEGLGADATSIKQATEERLNSLSRQGVQKEIDELRKKLEQKRSRENRTSYKDVDRAKEKVAQCLRVNDRRPLDCWEEVEVFKREVGKLEEAVLRKVWEG